MVLLPCSPCCTPPGPATPADITPCNFMFLNFSAFRAIEFAVEAELSGGFPSDISSGSHTSRDQGATSGDYVEHRYTNINYTHNTAYGIGTIDYDTSSFSNECGASFGIGSNDVCDATIVWRSTRQAGNYYLPNSTAFTIECNDSRLKTGNENDFSFTATLDAHFSFYDGTLLSGQTRAPHYGTFAYQGLKYVGGSLSSVCNSSVHVFGVPRVTYSVSMNPAQARSFLQNLLDGNRWFGLDNHQVGATIPTPNVLPLYNGTQTLSVDADSRVYYLQQLGTYYGFGDPSTDSCWTQTSWTKRFLDSSVIAAAPGPLYATISMDVLTTP